MGGRLKPEVGGKKKQLKEKKKNHSFWDSATSMSEEESRRGRGVCGGVPFTNERTGNCLSVRRGNTGLLLERVTKKNNRECKRSQDGAACACM